MATERAGYWGQMSDSVQNGTFWADRIKSQRDAPQARLATALENLPLPAAFREGCVATRMLIRKFGVETAEGQEMLKLLYWLAAVESFMLDYAPILQQPGFNVMESIPGSVMRELPFTFDQLGCDRLRLLNKTDKRWLVDVYGPPSAHRTLNELHRALWDRFEGALATKRKREDDELFGEIRSTIKAPPRPWWKFWA